MLMFYTDNAVYRWAKFIKHFCLSAGCLVKQKTISVFSSCYTLRGVYT